jgi:hypothetical protein
VEDGRIDSGPLVWGGLTCRNPTCRRDGLYHFAHDERRNGDLFGVEDFHNGGRYTAGCYRQYWGLKKVRWDHKWLRLLARSYQGN